MSQSYNYFMIPLAGVPQNPTYTVWFATWSRNQAGLTWSTERPDANPDTVATWAIGVLADDAPTAKAAPVAANDTLPHEVAVLKGTKELPPPFAAFSPRTASDADFQEAFAGWLLARSA